MCFIICKVCAFKQHIFLHLWKRMNRFDPIPPVKYHLESAFCVSHGVKMKAHNDTPLLHCHVLSLKPPEMAEHRNNSSQMQELLQPDNHSEECHKETHGHVREHYRKDGSSQATSASFSSSTSAPSSTGPVSRRQTERDKPLLVEPLREDGALSCCPLEDLKRLPLCTNKLGPLNFSRTHTVLVNVRVCPLQRLCSSGGK